MAGVSVLLLALCACAAPTVALSPRAVLAGPPQRVPPAPHLRLAGIIPPDSLTHFCVIASWENYERVLKTFAGFLGEAVPEIRLAGGPSSNGTYLGKKLLATTKIAFLKLNNGTRMEFLAGDPALPSWWRDVYLQRGFEVHHMGYALPEGQDAWAVVQSFQAAGLGSAKQWGRYTNGCYIYMDSQSTLGLTAEILGKGDGCKNVPHPPAS